MRVDCISFYDFSIRFSNSSNGLV